jgi:microcystin-dependent protein
MPNTPRLGLPYPATTAPADVPADMQSLANALDALVYIIGEVRSFAMLNAPAKWLRCDGSVVLQADYPELFAAISTLWNTGGETGAQFRLPPASGRALVGSGAGAGLTNRAVGARIGEETHALSGLEAPDHSHSKGSLSVAAHSHRHTANIGSTANRTQIIHPADGSLDGIGHYDFLDVVGVAYSIDMGGLGSGTSSERHIVTSEQTAPSVNGATGSSQGFGTANGHNIMQPSLAITMAIYAGR